MIENARTINIAATIFLVLGMFYILGPLYFTLMTASQSYDYVLLNGVALVPGDQLINNIVRVFTETRIPIQLANSLFVALVQAVGVSALSFLAAFAIVYFKSRLGTVLFALILATNFLPLETRVITSYQVASNIFSPLNALLDLTGLTQILEAVLGHPAYLELSILNTHVGLVLPLLATGTGTFLFRQYFRSMPKDLVKAAKMDGAGPLRFMWDILLPLTRTPILALFIMMFLSGWTNYLWPLIASSTPDMQTAVVGLARLAPDGSGEVPDFPLIMTGAVVVCIIPLLMVALLQRHIVQGFALSEK
ncbi:ABC transporter permease subunit [Pelagibacterium sp. H642]|uniref:carbohydrate ABC transporter permease n=1 Tax=Pelagibacterium sp. H642 TaxID=1881069 RepID=UPI002814B226|nr:ABC transporter permease subunit [Pelagibacterium sp. H642]WMT92724.1 ABC transporter permease subunit [Pelagibacterium sp. H642]